MRRSWLGGLDSNQDSQLQRLMYCRLYDLPAEGGTQNTAKAAATIMRWDNGIRQPRDKIQELAFRIERNEPSTAQTELRAAPAQARTEKSGEPNHKPRHIA